MNSYGESQSSRARARVPGSGGFTPDDQASRYTGAARSAPDEYRRGGSGRASVGSASVGSARASVGSASVGSARVGGRASVGGSSGGSAAVARAAVRPAPLGGSPGGPGDDGPGGGGGGGRGRSGGGKDRSKAAKKRRRTNILTAAAAVLVILLGAGVVGGTYFFDDVDLPALKPEDQSNTILLSDNTTLAKLGDQNRRVVPENQVLKYVKDAVAAAEDKNFYDHHGIDMKGIARAAWNNFTGGATQGASTITQQYARHAADLKAISINRKLREAVIARKLESKYDKAEIMGMYLNYIYLGEGRYGIEAAAQGYFGKSTVAKPGAKNAITVYEAAVLASIIKQPEPDKITGHKGYDPNINLVDAKARWEYTMKNMLEKKWITQEQYDQRKYPAVKKRGNGQANNTAVNKPVGMVIRHVRAELAEMGISEEEFLKGGLTVTTTINPKVQKAAQEAGSRNSKSSPMNGRPKTYQAAVIGIDPQTGRVLGYYGGDDPVGLDYGGYLNGTGDGFQSGGQSPGSTFKLYTLAAGLKEDISFKTTWDGTKLRPGGRKISNAGADPGAVCGGKIEFCDLETATIKSYNFPFYWIADGIGRDKVIQAAKDAGLKHMTTDAGKIVDLTKTDAKTWKSAGYFDNEVAFGQYRVIPLEHAEGVATLVGGGVHRNAHFIKEVKRVDAETGKVEIIHRENTKGKQVFDQAQMSNLQGVMQEIVKDKGRDLRSGRESVAKSGTWEYKKGSGDCWFVGGIPQLAATVWVGGAGNKVELKEPGGGDMFGSGTPAKIWREFLNEAAAALELPEEDFPERQLTGNDNSEYANGQDPPEVPDNNCVFGFIGPSCPENGNGTGNGNGNNNGNNNGNGNGNGTGNNNGTPTVPDVGTGDDDD
jgi:membrane peptidoglycan carboxypeptidase